MGRENGKKTIPKRSENVALWRISCSRARGYELHHILHIDIPEGAVNTRFQATKNVLKDCMSLGRPHFLSCDKHLAIGRSATSFITTSTEISRRLPWTHPFTDRPRQKKRLENDALRRAPRVYADAPSGPSPATGLKKRTEKSGTKKR